MLRKILLMATRDYVESVRTKAFIIGLVVAPLLPQTDGKPLLEAMSPPLPARAG